MSRSGEREAADFLAAQGVRTVRFGIVLGSGLGEFADRIEAEVALPYERIPHFRRSTVWGHPGVLSYGHLRGEACLVMAGRLHLYEGYTLDEVTFPIRVMGELGVRALIVTNAAGGIRRGLQVGDLMLVRDHVALVGGCPFPRVQAGGRGSARYYAVELLERARTAAAGEGIAVEEGVLGYMKGPCYETPAEIEMLRRAGADAVTMSTVPEVRAACAAGMQVLGLCVITNLAFGLPRGRVDHHAIAAAARKAQVDFGGLVERVVGGEGVGTGDGSGR